MLTYFKVKSSHVVPITILCLLAQVLTEDSSSSEVAAEAEGLVEAVLQGHNSVILALGQSGSGKTYTMAGDISPLDRTRTRTTGKP